MKHFLWFYCTRQSLHVLRFGAYSIQLTYFISRLAPSIEQIAKLYIPFKFVWDRFLEYNSYSKTPAVLGIHDTRQCHNATVEEIGSKVRLFNGFIKVVNYAIVALWPMDGAANLKQVYWNYIELSSLYHGYDKNKIVVYDLLYFFIFWL